MDWGFPRGAGKQPSGPASGNKRRQGQKERKEGDEKDVAPSSMAVIRLRCGWWKQLLIPTKARNQYCASNCQSSGRCSQGWSGGGSACPQPRSLALFRRSQSPCLGLVIPFGHCPCTSRLRAGRLASMASCIVFGRMHQRGKSCDSGVAVAALLLCTGSKLSEQQHDEYRPRQQEWVLCVFVSVCPVLSLSRWSTRSAQPPCKPCKSKGWHSLL